MSNDVLIRQVPNTLLAPARLSTRVKARVLTSWNVNTPLNSSFSHLPSRRTGFAMLLMLLFLIPGETKQPTWLTSRLKSTRRQTCTIYLMIPMLLKIYDAQKNQITAKFKVGNGEANAPTIPFDIENVIQWGRVKTYLSTSYVSSNAEKLVKSIDEMATKVLNKAASDAKKCATQQQIDAAKAEYISSRGTMEMIWENYIKFVTKQADVKQ
ncbi:hypothetical protein GGU11DRAFT_565978 [Lentinula aff. detonsa]|nr:hypothetical protein GGU11DRAFT_565978 [Lentinula aff. detonsa]